VELTGTGVWSAHLRYGDPDHTAPAARELEELGYTALWVPDIGGDIFGVLRTLLGATERIVIATGILNLWMHDAAETAAEFAAMDEAHPGRLLIGIGVSHAPLIDLQEAGRYRHPLQAMTRYLADLDAADPPLPVSRRVLAALGPRMLGLARDHAGGAHPYLAPPANTRRARDLLGPGPLLAPEQPVVLETDPAAARTIARRHLRTYLQLPNYTNNLLRCGFTEEDIADEGSDHLVDSIVAWGDEAAIRARVQEHRDAGADHVCIQVLMPDPTTMPLAVWRALAPSTT
jgi:probable F420-dependent oxidoreductase